MNANLTNLITSAAAVLAMTSSAFAQQSRQGKMNNGCPCPPFEQGTPLTNCENFPPAYNAPARTEVRCSWDVFLTGSFLYWFVGQEGMDIGYNASLSPTTTPTAVVPPDNALKVAQKGEFKPGFKVGIGLNMGLDDWVGYLEYTWLHGSTSQSTNAGADPRGTPAIILGTWYNQNTGSVLNATASTVSSRWRVNLDMLDGTLSRPFYQGRNLTLTPYSGARALWIRQNFRLSATTTNAATGITPVSHNSSKSWGLGPLAGMQGHWQLGWGFRLEGDASAAVVYQRYTKVSHSEDAITTTSPWNQTSNIRYKDMGALRPMADMGMGIGWGSYLDCQNFYLDIVATYDFFILWGQNMMRHLVDDFNYGVDGAPEELYYNGMTLTMRFDF